MVKKQATGIFVLVLTLLAISWWQWRANPLLAGACTAGNAVSKSFATGATWDLCWHEAVAEGIVLSDIYYTPPSGERRKVLQEASLSQIEVLYDDGLATNYYTSEPGLGEAQLLTLTTDDCPNGTLLSNRDRAVLCQQSGPRGYLYKYYTVQKQGEEFTLLSASQIGQKLYLVKWRFVDDGTIEPTVGDGGRLLRQGQDPAVGWPIDENAQIGIGYITNYWWRLDFDLAGNGANDFVDAIAVNAADSRRQRITSAIQLDREGGYTTDPDLKRSWRVRDGALKNSDGHAVSYHLDPRSSGYFYGGSDADPWDANDLYVTVNKACERLAAHNPTCGANVADFVDGESIAGADIVLWYRVTTHRLPRVEDLPLLTVEWHSFQLLPRDWTAQNPF